MLWNRPAEEEDRRLGHRREKPDKIVSVTGTNAVVVLQKLLTRRLAALKT
jgi:hypothetical protein